MPVTGRGRSVDFSRFMGGGSLASLAMVVGCGIVGYAAGAPILMRVGEDGPAVMAVAGLVFLPVVLCLVARSTESWRSGTAYGMVRSSGSASLAFATGWLSLGGYLAVGAMMVETLAVRISHSLRAFLEIDLPLIALVAPITVLAGLAEMVLPSERSRLRSLFGWAALGLTAGFGAWLSLFPPAPVPEAAMTLVPGRHWLSGATLAAAGLWLVEIVTDYRRHYRGSDRSLAGIACLGWAVTIGLCAWLGALVWRHPEFFGRAALIDDPSLALQQSRILGVYVMFTLCGTVLVKALARALRVAGAMALDGMLPAALEHSDREDRLPRRSLLVLALIVMGLAAWVDHVLLVGVAAIAFLWLAFLVIASGLATGAFRERVRLRLPLHPLLPLLALVAAGFFSLMGPRLGLGLVAGWMVVGFLAFRAVRGRSGELLAVVEGEEAAEDQELPDDSPDRVLVGLGPASDARALIELGVRLAVSRGGDLVVLKVESLLEQLPRTQVRRAAARQWEALQEMLAEVAPEGLSAYPLVRIAPTAEAGILEGMARHRPDLVLLDLPEGDDGGPTEHALVVQRILAEARPAVAVLRGRLPDRHQAWSVLGATADGETSGLILSLGSGLAGVSGGAFTALRVHAPAQSDEEALGVLRARVEEAGVEASLAARADVDVGAGISAEASSHDLVVLGITQDQVNNRTGLAGVWGDLTRRWGGPSLMVRGSRGVRSRWLSRFWDLAFLGLPTLTVSEQAEVYAEMRHSAGASKDFYALTVIASSIATFGLLQDSAAVIIGAMLVAPLMSPITAIGQGIVQGNVALIRRGTTSTLKGTVVAVAVALGFVILTPELSPTAQILARTEPTLLDLGVGLAAGAAAAYGVSRKSVAAALPGVAISVALVPPLCVVGYGLGTERFDIAFGSLVLFLTNLAAIVLVCVVVFLLLGFTRGAKERGANVRTAVAVNIFALAVLCIPLGISSCHTTRTNQVEAAVARAFRKGALARDFHLDSLSVKESGEGYLLEANVFAAVEVTPQVLAELELEVEEAANIDVDIDLFVVRAVRIGTAATEEATPVPDQAGG